MEEATSLVPHENIADSVAVDIFDNNLSSNSRFVVDLVRDEGNFAIFAAFRFEPEEQRRIVSPLANRAPTSAYR